jgi:hypothetical protein
MNKKILLLYRPVEGKKLSTMLLGNKRLKIIQYKNIEEIAEILENFFKTKPKNY